MEQARTWQTRHSFQCLLKDIQEIDDKERTDRSSDPLSLRTSSMVKTRLGTDTDMATSSTKGTTAVADQTGGRPTVQHPLTGPPPTMQRWQRLTTEVGGCWTILAASGGKAIAIESQWQHNYLSRGWPWTEASCTDYQQRRTCHFRLHLTAGVAIHSPWHTSYPLRAIARKIRQNKLACNAQDQNP